MALFFAPVANVVLSAVRPEEEGQASGANNAIRELGGVFGVAVLAVGLRPRRRLRERAGVRRRHEPGVLIGAAVVGVGALAAFIIPTRQRVEEQPVEEFVPELQAAA